MFMIKYYSSRREIFASKTLKILTNIYRTRNFGLLFILVHKLRYIMDVENIFIIVLFTIKIQLFCSSDLQRSDDAIGPMNPAWNLHYLM